MLNIQLPAEVLFKIGPLPVTNSILATAIITIIVAIFAIWFSRTIKMVPRRWQVAMEAVHGFWMKQATSAFGSAELAKTMLPMFFTLFILLTLANQFALIPLAGAMFFGDAPAFRTPTSDLSHTIALAIAVIAFAHIVAFTAHPLQHLGNYIKIKPILKIRSGKDAGNALIEVFLGLMDIIGEIAKVLSLSGRLFGNIFAGDVMVLVIASLAAATYYIVPIPFIFLSLFSGFVQAAVFTMLSMLFIAGTAGTALQERASK
jgi:F-type H+-transporting ATPase subunit a